MGYYFDDFKVGQEFITPGRTITEADVVQFAGLTGDYNPIHTDNEFCKTSMFGQRVAHGLLVMSIARGLYFRLGNDSPHALAFLDMEEWRFTKPVFFGDTIHVKVKIVELRESKKITDRGIVVEEHEVINQRDEVVQLGQAKVLYKRK